MNPKPKPCDNCRKNHLKCDDAIPKCLRCQKSSRECIRRKSKFQFHNTSFDGALSTSSGSAVLHYIDETPKFTGAPVANTTQEDLPDASESQPVPGFSSNGIFAESERENSGLSPIHLPPSSTERPISSLKINLGEAFLLRYFVEELAKWFDLCDPERHFGLVVPQRARGCAPLLNALLCTSARHFTTLPGFRQKEFQLKFSLMQGLVINEEAVLDYHNRCITHLRLMADEPGAIMDENLLAAVVVLRLYEELDNPFTFESPTDTAIRGLQFFLEAQASLALYSTGFRSAVFWVGFRQEFHMAYSQQRSFRLPLKVCDDYLNGGDAPDHVLVNRLLIICAHIVQYCYDDQSPVDSISYEGLVHLYHHWLNNRPASFFPVFSASPDRENNEVFPQRWYLNDYHILAENSIGLIDILLSAYDPTIARIGPGQRGAEASLDSKLKSIVLEICGIALSNRQSPTALLAACIAITICGDRFTDRFEQEALMGVVDNTILDTNYWPPTSIKARMRSIWGWDS